MNLDVTATLDKVGKEVKAAQTLILANNKASCKLSFVVTKEKKDLVSAQGAVKEINAMDLASAKVTKVTVLVEGTKSFGRFFNRNVGAMAILCLDMKADLSWDAEAGAVEIVAAGGVPLTGSDLPFLFDLIHRMVNRACGALSHTQHPMTLFDLKQATRVIWGVQQRDSEAEALADWMAPRELISLEAKKEEMKAKAAATPKAEPKAKSPAKGEGKAKASGITKSTNGKGHVDPEMDGGEPAGEEKTSPAQMKKAANQGGSKGKEAAAKTGGKTKTATLGNLS